MSFKTTPIRVCDFCGKTLAKKAIVCEDVSNEGCSTITLGNHTYSVDNYDYCDFNCLMDHIRTELGLIKVSDIRNSQEATDIQIVDSFGYVNTKNIKRVRVEIDMTKNLWDANTCFKIK